MTRPVSSVLPRKGRAILLQKPRPTLAQMTTTTILIAAVIATQRVLRVDVPLAEVADLLKLSGVFDVVVVAVALVTFEFVVEE